MTAQKQEQHQKSDISNVVRLKKLTAEKLDAVASDLKLTPAESVERALQHWFNLTPSQKLGISSEMLYSMAKQEGVKIDA